jgi:ribonuclease BN (tRNA processing enzyme)
MRSFTRFVGLAFSIIFLSRCAATTPKARIDAPASERSPLRTKVVLLGTGTPNAEPDRSGSAVAIIVDDTPYIIDCGPGVVRRATAAFEKGIGALEPSKLKRLFITHLHSDHTLGYPDLILTPWVLGRSEPLAVYGPVGTQAMTDHILQAYKEDIRIRTEGDEPAKPDEYLAVVTEIEPGVIYKDENVTVKAFPVRHGAWEHAYGFRFETPDRTIVISGDTSPTPVLVEHAFECDILIHEVYSQAAFERREPRWQRYHSKSHTSSAELARIAESARPGLLILYHQLYWGATDEELLSEIRERYKGKVVSGKDLDVF